MDSIPSPFTIEINGKPVARVDDNAEDGAPARLGKDAAVFRLTKRQLRCGDWIMGRNVRENRSFAPKAVSWCKADGETKDRVQPVTAKKDGDAYTLIFTNGAVMVDDSENVRVDLHGESDAKVDVILREG